MRLRRPSPATVIALLALIVALSGTALAASRYIITSTSQIKPSVLRQLRGTGPVAGSSAIPKGPKTVIDRIRASNVVMDKREGSVPVTGATWTQQPGQVNALIGQVTGTSPPFAGCGAGAQIHLTLDGGVSHASAELRPTPTESTRTYPFGWFGAGGGTEWLMEPATASTHTVQLDWLSYCEPGEHFTIDSLAIDVLAFR